MPAGCSAVVRTVGQWPGGFQGEILVTNQGSVPLDGWTVTFAFPDGQTISQLWGGTHSQSGQNVAVVNAPWNGSLAPGTTTTAGFLGTWTGANGAPTGVACR